MLDIFDKNLFQQIIAGIVILLVSILLGAKSKAPTTSGKGWKVAVIFAWIMILGGLWLFGQNINNGGFQNPYTGAGFSLFFFGIILKYIGRFFVWWHR